MLALALGALAGSAATCWLVGATFVADRDSGLRTKRGILLVVVLVASFVFLPPQLLGMGSLGAGSAEQLGAVGLSLTWPEGLNKGVYVALWLITSAAGLLVGARIWDAGKPGWRDTGGSAYDTSTAGRARGLLALADSLDDGLDTLARTGVDARGVASLAEDLRALGRRVTLPPDSASTYRAVAAKLPAGVAAAVTKHLLEGSGRT